MTCINDASCSNKVAFEAVATVGRRFLLKEYDPTARCRNGGIFDSFTCTPRA
jgi:hypothetical protein